MSNKNEKSIILESVLPFTSEVDGKVLVTELESVFKKYLVLPLFADTALALWVLFSYGFENFEFSPRLAILSPERRCGKTSLLSLLEALCSKPLMASSITAAVMFRMIEQEKPTLLIDEADTFLKDNEGLRGVINAGHRRNGFVLRTEGKSFTPKAFRCFCPCTIASIGALSGTITDRSIIITMRRKLSTENVSRLRSRIINFEMQELRQKCARFMQDNGEKAGLLVPNAPNGLNDRAVDNWEPLFAIADTISPEYGEKARSAALALASIDDDSESNKIILLRDIKSIFDESPGVEWIRSQDLCTKLINLPDTQWSEYNNGKPLTTHKISNMLRSFSIRTHQRKEGSVNTNHYHIPDFGEVFKSYITVAQ